MGIINKEIDNIKCSIYLENKKSISQPNCNCFKICYYGDENINEPAFPYPDIEDELNQKWEKEYPLINLYNKKCDEIQKEQDTQYDNEYYQRKCPLCHK